MTARNILPVVVLGAGVAVVLWLVGLSSVAECVPATPGFLFAISKLGGEVQSWGSGAFTLPVDLVFFVLLLLSIRTSSTVVSVVGISLLSILMSGLAAVFSIPMSNSVILARVELVQEIGLKLASAFRISDNNFFLFTFIINSAAFVALCLLCRVILQRYAPRSPKITLAKGN